MAAVTVGAVSGVERFRGTGTGAVSRILREHRACDAGFDVSRHPGRPGGRLRIRCKGCGQEMVYHASDAGSWGALQDLDGGGPFENGAHRRPWAGLGRPGWGTVSLIAALVLAAALAAIVLSGEGEDDGSGSSSVTSVEGTSGSTEAPAGKRPPKGPAEEPSGKAKERVVVLQPRIVPSGGFSIGLAPGWHKGVEDGAIVFARGKDAEVRVFYERGARSYPIMLEGLGDLLRNEHPKARISRVAPFWFGDVFGRKLRADYPGGRELGVATAAGGYSYFVLVRVDRGAEPAAVREARAIHASFRVR
jgi:hypothetical protein